MLCSDRVEAEPRSEPPPGEAGLVPSGEKRRQPERGGWQRPGSCGGAWGVSRERGRQMSRGSGAPRALVPRGARFLGRCLWPFPRGPIPCTSRPMRAGKNFGSPGSVERDWGNEGELANHQHFGLAWRRMKEACEGRESLGCNLRESGNKVGGEGRNQTESGRRELEKG